MSTDEWYDPLSLKEKIAWNLAGIAHLERLGDFKVYSIFGGPES